MKILFVKEFYHPKAKLLIHSGSVVVCKKKYDDYYLCNINGRNFKIPVTLAICLLDSLTSLLPSKTKERPHLSDEQKAKLSVAAKKVIRKNVKWAPLIKKIGFEKICGVKVDPSIKTPFAVSCGGLNRPIR